jgi:hypothetical protein
MKHALALLSLVIATFVVSGSTGAAAQSATTYSAGNQWGTVSSGVAVNGGLESAQSHAVNGASAAAVNAASRGMLVGTGTGSLTISSIGSQTIVSSSVVATNSTVTSPINATQSATNSGDVSNTGTINVK